MHITRQCGLLHDIQPGDAVMVVKGFVHLKNDLQKIGAKLYCPPFKTKVQFTKKRSRKYHTNRFSKDPCGKKNGANKKFRLLQGIIPLTLAPIANDFFFASAALTNI